MSVGKVKKSTFNKIILGIFSAAAFARNDKIVLFSKELDYFTRLLK